MCLGLLLILLVGPAEEIFWRGYVQRTLESICGAWVALVVTGLIYTLVHIWSFNFMLIMSALVCGAFWGLLYKYNKNLVNADNFSCIVGCIGVRFVFRLSEMFGNSPRK